LTSPDAFNGAPGFVVIGVNVLRTCRRIWEISGRQNLG
jgi:hypothetical protein